MKIVCKNNLARRHECLAIVELISSLGDNQNVDGPDKGVLYYSSKQIAAENEFIHGLLGVIAERVKLAAEEIVREPLNTSQLAIFKTIPGHTPEEHADSQNMDGSPKDGCSDFVASAVVYFNENFQGGELVFPKVGFSYKPIAGDCLIFPSTADYSHYVDRVLEGERIVLPLWFSRVG
jgi:hypothetical protein